MRKKNPNS